MKRVLALWICSSMAFGGVKWKTTTVVLEVHPLQGIAPVVFHYANVGSESVVITEVKVNCGCLVPEKEFEPLPPGGRGDLKIDFDLFNRMGPQRKIITVKTSDGATERLSIVANLPETYDIAPRLMKILSTGPSSNTAVLKNKSPMPLPLQSVESSNEQIHAELVCIKEGFEYAVVVTPLDIHENHRAIIRIFPKMPAGLTEVKTFKFYVFASKQDPPAQP
ncbi:MAG: DUF1573 domain-containing protein [Pontiella sp.]